MTHALGKDLRTTLKTPVCRVKDLALGLYGNPAHAYGVFLPPVGVGRQDMAPGRGDMLRWTRPS